MGVVMMRRIENLFFLAFLYLLVIRFIFQIRLVQQLVGDLRNSYTSAIKYNMKYTSTCPQHVGWHLRFNCSKKKSNAAEDKQKDDTFAFSNLLRAASSAKSTKNEYLKKKISRQVTVHFRKSAPLRHMCCGTILLYPYLPAAIFLAASA